MHASMGAVKAAPPLGSVRTEPRQRSGDDAYDSDATLALRLASGDTSALDILYRRHHDPALAVALSLLRDRSAAEDLVHEAFLRAWRRVGSFRSDRGAFRSWLLAIVRNAAIDQLRQQAIQRRPEIVAAQEFLYSASEPDIPTQVFLSLDAEHLHQALARLSPEQRAVIQQSFFAELSHREIAQLEGLPLGTVKGRVRLGLHRLRIMLEHPERGSRPG